MAEMDGYRKTGIVELVAASACQAASLREASVGCDEYKVPFRRLDICAKSRAFLVNQKCEYVAQDDYATEERMVVANMKRRERVLATRMEG
jgi:hypothetical protein